MTSTPKWPDRPLNRKEAANYLQDVHGYKISANTLACLATRGGSPPYYKVSRWVLFEKTDLDTWVEERKSTKVSSTSESTEVRGPQNARQ
jgi:hypothetical protein